MEIDGVEILDGPTEPGDSPWSSVPPGLRRKNETLATVLRVTVCVLVRIVRVAIMLSLAIGHKVGQVLQMALENLERVEEIRTSGSVSRSGCQKPRT